MLIYSESEKRSEKLQEQTQREDLDITQTSSSTPSECASDDPDNSSKHNSLSSSVSSLHVSDEQWSNRISPFLVADLRQANEKQLSFHDLAATSQYSGCIQGFRYFARDQGGAIDGHHLRAIQKSNKLFAKIEYFFGGFPDSSWNHKSHVHINWSDGGALVGGPPNPGHAAKLEGISAFQKVDFTFFPLRSLPLRSSQLLHFACPSLNVGETLFGNTGYSSVDIVSGVCLFNANIMSRSCTQNGTLHLKHLEYAHPTLYELEYIARAATAIADIAASIVLNEQCNIPMVINLDVPSFHYYQMLDELIAAHQCSVSDAFDWVKAVENRSKIVGRVFRLAIMQEIERRSRSILEKIEVRVSRSTDSVVRKSLWTAFRSQRIPIIEDVLRDLDAQEDEAWNRFISILPEKDRPRSFRNLAYAFYVFECIKPALVKEKEANRRLLLSIDDGAERRIYSRAQKILKKLRQEGISDYRLMELYLSRRIFINGNRDGSNLYLDDPTPEPIVLANTEHASNHLDSPASPTRTPLSPLNIISALYGRNLERNLQDLFEGEGLVP